MNNWKILEGLLSEAPSLQYFTIAAWEAKSGFGSQQHLDSHSEKGNSLTDWLLLQGLVLNQNGLQTGSSPTEPLAWPLLGSSLSRQLGLISSGSLFFWNKGDTEKITWPRNGRYLHLTQKGEGHSLHSWLEGDFQLEKCGNQQVVQGPSGKEEMPRLPRGGSF